MPPLQLTEFLDCFLKIERAEKHIEELKAFEVDYFKHQVMEVKPFSNHLGNGIMITNMTPYTPLLGAGPIIGDVVHNLRAALDIMACVLVERATPSTPKVYFPMAKDEAELSKQIKDKKFDKAGAVAVQRRMDLFGGKAEHSIRGIHELDLEDKHRNIVAQNPTMVSPHFQVQADGTMVQINDARNFLSFKEGSYYDGEEVVVVLQTLIDETKNVLTAFMAP